MKKIVAIAWICAFSCMAAETSDQPVKQYAEKYTGYDIALGVGYSGLTVAFTHTTSNLDVVDLGASGVAIQARMGGTYGFFDYWIIGLEWYGQYNSARIFKSHQHGSESAEQHFFKMPWNLGFQGKIGFVYKPSNMIFIIGGPDWGYYSFQDSVDALSSSQFNVGWRFGAGAEQKFAVHWVMKEIFDYGWYPSKSYTHSNETDRVNPNLATLLFSCGYLF